MTVEQTNKDVVKEKKPSEPAPLAKEEIEALNAYATGMFRVYLVDYFKIYRSLHSIM